MRYFLILSCLIALSCTDPIDIKVQDGQSQLVVDAWLTNQDTLQTIILSYSQGYFDGSAVKGASGATVFISKLGVKYQFVESDKPGYYVYDTKSNGAFTVDENPYTLTININGEEYKSTTELKRVPPIDSIRYEYYQRPINIPDEYNTGFLAEFYSVDPIGSGDTYWIKTTINDSLKNDPSNISLAYDAGFSENSLSDGLLFILPIRRSIDLKLFQQNDKLKVEIFSISNEAFDFLQSVQVVTTSTGLFDVPAANLPSNISNVNISSKNKPVGFFNLSAVSSMEVVIDSTQARPLDP